MSRTRRHARRSWGALAALMLSLAAAGCGGDDDPEAADSAAAAETTEAPDGSEGPASEDLPPRISEIAACLDEADLEYDVREDPPNDDVLADIVVKPFASDSVTIAHYPDVAGATARVEEFGELEAEAGHEFLAVGTETVKLNDPAAPFRDTVLDCVG